MVNTAKSIKLLLKCGTRTWPDRTFLKLERVIGTKASIGNVPFCRHRREVSGKHEMQNARNRIERTELDCMNWIEIAWHQMNEWMKWSDMNRHEITWNKRTWNEWMSEWVSEWINEPMNEWMNYHTVTVFPNLVVFQLSTVLICWFMVLLIYCLPGIMIKQRGPTATIYWTPFWPLAGRAVRRSAALSCLSSYFASLLYASSWATYYD